VIQLDQKTHIRSAMATWKQAANDDIRSGTAAALASAAILMLCGWLQHRRPAGPLNGPSQWLWGARAAYRTNATARHTATGYLIHHATSVFWATLFEKSVPREKSAHQSTLRLAAKGLTAAALAAFVDYKLTPRRLQPGFDKQLSRGSMVAVYASFGVGLVASRIIEAGGTRSQRRQAA
jgi:hypothetical protein